MNPLEWKAIAGISIQIPPVGARVYYFPQGHAEQASAPPDFSSFRPTTHSVLCRLIGVEYLANVHTDEVFAKMRLVPFIGASQEEALEPEEEKETENKGVTSFAKVLTPSDANNGGGFSVPRFCADAIFPPLDYNADPPVQTIRVRDSHGTMWEFRHIFRGTPRRHLLTTGWSRFVNCKKLVAGDSVVFVKNAVGGLFVGIRRANRPSVALDYSIYGAPPIEVKSFEGVVGDGEGFSRNCRGRVPPDTVVEAVRSAEMGRPFEVMYYPRGWPEFVLRAQLVEERLSLYWASGTRIKMLAETDESARTSWFQGTVTCTVTQEPGLWPHSPWRMLQVVWDDPEILQAKNVSPWQVELVPPLQVSCSYPPFKKLRGFPTGREVDILIPGFGSTVMGDLSPSLFSYNLFPAGMQGARQEPMCVPNLSPFVDSANASGKSISQNLKHVSTDLNIWNSFPSESSSPPSQNSVLYYGTEDIFKPNYNPTMKGNTFSIQLFGKTIHMERPVDGDVSTNGKAAEAIVEPPAISYTCSPNEFCHLPSLPATTIVSSQSPNKNGMIQGDLPWSLHRDVGQISNTKDSIKSIMVSGLGNCSI